MTNDLLLKVWDRLEPDLRKRLTLIIKFHHPEFNPSRRTSFPELEPLLSAMEANRGSSIIQARLRVTFARKTSKRFPTASCGMSHSGSMSCRPTFGRTLRLLVG
jgi:hypothetical protein